MNFSLLRRAMRAIAIAGLVGLITSVGGDRSLQAQAPLAIIDNGTVQLGVNPEGNLIVPGTVPSRPDNTGSENLPTTDVGLRFIPTNGEALAPGCPCEGWGVANAVGETTTFSAFANKSELGSPSNMVVESGPGGTGVTNNSGQTKIESNGSAFKSVVTAGGRLRVTHDYHPSSVSPNLYEIVVTIQNVGFGTLGDVRYRRVMDFDVPPTTFHEWVQIHIPPTSDGILFRATTDGFQSADPLSSPGPGVGSPPTTLSYGEGGTTDYLGGPTDQGALFDLMLGSLAGLSEGDPLQSGEAKSFKIYYGAAANKTEALNAISDVGATAYALGISSTSFSTEPPAPANNDDNVFIFAYGETADGTYGKTWDFGDHAFSLDFATTQQFPDLAVTTKESLNPEGFAQAVYPDETLLPMGPTPGLFTLYTIKNPPMPGEFSGLVHSYVERLISTVILPPCRPRLIHKYSTGSDAGKAFDETIEYYPIPPAGPPVSDPGIGDGSRGFSEFQPVDLGDPDGAADRFEQWISPKPDGSTSVSRNSTMVVKFKFTPGPAPKDPRLSIAKLDRSNQGFEPKQVFTPINNNLFTCDTATRICRISFSTATLEPGTYMASVNSLTFCAKAVRFTVTPADDDDFDDDDKRDDEDDDDDDDGKNDDADDDDDNDGEKDNDDSDDDNDDIEDEFDSESARDEQTAISDEVDPGKEKVYDMVAGSGTLLLTATAESFVLDPLNQWLQVEIYAPNGTLLATSPPTPGRAVAAAVPVLPGTYKVKVKNIGQRQVRYETLRIARIPW